ncbi:MAG: hypothetical protein PWQ64_127 [Desulfomicrobiaceae bacterium]|jgi:hypothetical protein|nr:hypothetical protein [Desulfomicrobiaceae bacterium]MDK2872363.1 hypothetical protein [Desulfomicrobiaceae bacterium]HCF05821.1 hypothetical protein [Desulfomicrobiaceae bacterium]
MGMTIFLLFLAAVAAFMAVRGLVRGSIYCKGGPYSRDTEPGAFWASIVAYVFWAVLMLYFAFFRSA